MSWGTVFIFSFLSVVCAAAPDDLTLTDSEIERVEDTASRAAEKILDYELGRAQTPEQFEDLKKRIERGLEHWKESPKISDVYRKAEQKRVEILNQRRQKTNEKFVAFQAELGIAKSPLDVVDAYKKAEDGYLFSQGVEQEMKRQTGEAMLKMADRARTRAEWAYVLGNVAKDISLRGANSAFSMATLKRLMQTNAPASVREKLGILDPVEERLDINEKAAVYGAISLSEVLSGLRSQKGTVQYKQIKDQRDRFLERARRDPNSAAAKVAAVVGAPVEKGERTELSLGEQLERLAEKLARPSKGVVRRCQDLVGQVFDRAAPNIR